MEKKEYKDYSEDELKQLVIHWFDYYGNVPIRLDVYEKLMELIDTNVGEMFCLSLYEYLNNKGRVVSTLTDGDEKAIEAMLAVGKLLLDDIDCVKNVADAFLSEIVETYNHPEPAVPMDEESIIASVLEQLGISIDDVSIIDGNEYLRSGKIREVDLGQSSTKKKDYQSSDMEREVDEIFTSCFFTEEELENNVPRLPYTPVEGLTLKCAFNTKRINKYKGKIKKLIDRLPDVDYGASFLKLFCDKDGVMWTSSQLTVEELMLLGLASEILVYTLPREFWDKLEGGLPRLTRDKSKEDTLVIGHDPSEFHRDKGDDGFQKRK